MKESTQERKFRAEAQGRGLLVVKVGREGWPDQLVGYAPGRHLWLEWKTWRGRLTAAQCRRIPQLRDRGEVVEVVQSVFEAWFVVNRQPKETT